MVADAWLIWGMIGSFKACEGILDLLVVITLADGTGEAVVMVLVIALVGTFLVLQFLGQLATGGSMARGLLLLPREYASARHCPLQVVSACTSGGK